MILRHGLKINGQGKENFLVFMGQYICCVKKCRIWKLGQMFAALGCC